MAKAKKVSPKVKTKYVLTLTKKEAGALLGVLASIGDNNITDPIFGALSETGVDSTHYLSWDGSGISAELTEY